MRSLTPDLEDTHWDISSIVEALRESRENQHSIRHRGRVRELPSRDAIKRVLVRLREVLFPTHYGHIDLNDESIDYFVGHALNEALGVLKEQVRRSLLFSRTTENATSGEVGGIAADITHEFGRQLPEIRAQLVSDVHAAYEGDPAAANVSEILLCYPGMSAILDYRFAHALHALGAQFLARLMSDIAHSRTGIDIHPGAQIGPSFFIDHGTGVVIGETAIIGTKVRLYQAVTLGAKRFETGDDGALVKGGARHPIVEDRVVIYAGATILGRITVGADSVIGGNVWLTHSVPPGSQISQARMRNT